MMKSVTVVVGLFVCVTSYAQDSLFRNVTFHGKHYFVADIDPKKYNIELFNKLDAKHSQHDFGSIDSVKGEKLVLIVNGGMFQKDLRPLGLYVSDGKTCMNVKRDTTGYGNFYMQPNGMFVLDKNLKAGVITTSEYSEKSAVNLATQSGPMLVTKGVINSHFTQGSTNLNIRNGVGINKQGHVVFVNSEDPINFYEFAELYRDQLNCQSALYLDGFVSQYYSPELHQSPQQTIPLGVFIVVTKK
jgi:uncharacterized protein YigE (DUF2233 family)